MTFTSDARGIYRSTSDASSAINHSSSAQPAGTITAADPSFQAAYLPGTSVDSRFSYPNSASNPLRR